MFEWTAFEAAFVETAEAAIDKWFTKNSKQHVYAIAFHECYCELDGPIVIPSLGINSVEKYQPEAGTDEENYKWAPGIGTGRVSCQHALHSHDLKIR